MTSHLHLAGLLALGLALGGCATASNLLNDGFSGRSGGGQQQAQANSDLSMPPDLQLRPPQEAAQVASNNQGTATTTSPITGAAQPKGDVYEQYGVSKTHPDGSPKTDIELRRDLKAAILARKRQQNPSYGTIGNLGALFSSD